MSISHKSSAKLGRILGQWSKALIHATAEHGTDNSFGVVELAQEYGITRADGYRIGATRMRELGQWTRLEITYAKGRFDVVGPRVEIDLTLSQLKLLLRMANEGLADAGARTDGDAMDGDDTVEGEVVVEILRVEIAKAKVSR